MLNFFSKWFGRERTVSQAAKSLEQIFENHNEGQLFFDCVIKHFQNYDKANDDHHNDDFPADIEFIIHFTTKTLDSTDHLKSFRYRTDGYFYIYCRVLEYIHLAKVPREMLKEFQKQLYIQLADTFESTKGLKPCLVLTDKDLLKRMKIQDHFMLIHEIKDTQTIYLFFALSKLWFQASLIIDEPARPQWSEMFSKVQICKVEFFDIMSKYIECKQAFEHHPLDIPAFIYLIQNLQPFKSNQTSSPFEILINLMHQLNFNCRIFFEHYQSTFAQGVVNRTYELPHVVSLFQMLSTQDEKIFEIYLKTYVSKTQIENLWGMFVFISRTSDINDVMEKHLSATLSQRFEAVPVRKFKEYHSRLQDCLKQAKVENRPHCLKIFEQMFHAFLNKHLTDDQYSYQLTEDNLKELFNIATDLSSTDRLSDPSYLLIFRHLFKLDKNIHSKPKKIKCLLERLNNFNMRLFQENNPADIIQDDWLNDYIFHTYQEWLGINNYDYRDFCDTHRNNPWSIHIWSMIINLSFSKIDVTKFNEALVSVNDWMKKVKHNVYDASDILTNIFVKYIFKIIILKRVKSAVLLSNIDELIHYVLYMRQNSSEFIDAKLVDDFIDYVKQSINEVLLLKSIHAIYLELTKESIASQFLSDIDVKQIVTSQDPQCYRFPLVGAQIGSIVSMERPDDINITDIDSQLEYFYNFVKQVKRWLEWFDRFIDVSQTIIEWLNSRRVEGADQLLTDIQTIKNDPTISVLKTKSIVQKIIKVLNSFKNLERLCDLFDCVNSFVIVDEAALSERDQYQSYMKQLKDRYQNSTFSVNPKKIEVKTLPIEERRRVHWSIASVTHPCNIKVEYRTNDSSDQSHELFSRKDVHLEHHYLQGKFQTQRGGQLVVTIDNINGQVPRTICYRITQKSLSTCHLFHGILNMYYKKYFPQSHQPITERDFNDLIQQVFSFIDKLLDGETTLEEMNDLKPVFHDKNINVRNEVQKLSTNRAIESHTDINDQQITQVFQWLQTYQVYSHLNNIINCVRKFDIISSGNENDESINNLEEMTIDENCSLKNMSKTYEELYQRFESLNNHHLQLIKVINECSNVIQMMKKFDLYSTNGLRRFQELRDNLTTQFQLQERNNIILNSWIISYTLCKPFVNQVGNLEEFIDNLSRLSNIDESSLEHIRIVNNNIQIVTMWLSAEEITMLDNALITMEHIYKTGTVTVHLRHLMNEESDFKIEYSIDKMSNQSNDEDDPDNDKTQQSEKLKILLSMADIDDHKRQLTFCNVDLQSEMIYKKMLLNEQLKLLQLIEKIYSMLLKLEMAGHPNFQLQEIHHDIFDTYGQIKKILSALQSYPDDNEQELEQIVQDRTRDFQTIYSNLETTYKMWIKALDEYRHKNSLLKLFSNRQIMILIILLTAPSINHSIQGQFLSKLFSVDNHERDKDLTILCLIHYLQSLRLHDCDLSIAHITELYRKYRLEQGSSPDLCLKQLCLFLKDVFNNGKELSTKTSTNNENQQYLIVSNSSDRTKIDNEFDMDICCTLINIFNDRLPADYQILWCSIATEDDIRLFFSRVRTFRNLTFAVLDVDKMPHRLREILLTEQDVLSKLSESHGPVYYFSKEFNLGRKGLRPFYITPKHRNPSQTYQQFISLLQQNNYPSMDIQIIYGQAGIGKTHRIKMQCKDDNTSCVSINDKINVSSLISSLISYESKTLNNQLSIYFNISIHAPFEQLNRLLFSLFICGSLNDLNSGLTFSSLITKRWKYIIEVPYTEKSNVSIQDNFKQILPLFSIIASKALEEVTDQNYQLYIGEEEELVARFLKAYENGTIDTRMQTPKRHFEIEKPVDFERLTDHNECRNHIYRCIEIYAPDLPRNKIFELSFTKFLYRRVRFFTGVYYRYNMTDPYLGSTTMKQMIEEAKCLTRIDFSLNNYPRVYLVYDPEFSLYLLHNNWIQVPATLKALFDNENPSKRDEFRNKDYFVKCLAWLIDIQYDVFIEIMIKEKFILTENFVYKLFHVHERKLTKLALIIEGETGVGKTFLLHFYSSLLNANITHGNLNDSIIPRIPERTSLWLWKTVIDKILKQRIELLNRFLQRIEGQLCGDDAPMESERFLYDDFLNDEEEDDDDDDEDEVPGGNQPVNQELLRQIQRSLEKGEYNSTILRRIWQTIVTISNENSTSISKKLFVELCDFVILQLTNSPLTDASQRLGKLLEPATIITAQTSIEIFDEFLEHTRIKPLFYRLLLHPGVTEEQIEEFMSPICQLARQLPSLELVVFFDEVNTSSCLGLFKEMFMDGTLHGKSLPKNIFFTAAINPLSKTPDNLQVHRRDYLVHELPESLENLKVCYGVLDPPTLQHYVRQKIASFTVASSRNPRAQMPLEKYAQDMLADAILQAQNFCEKRLGPNSVSQREIQRCFNLIDFFWKMRYDENEDDPNPVRCIALALALIYYFRLPTKEDNAQRNDQTTPSREELGELLSRSIPEFEETIQHELHQFVNSNNFVIPNGVAINQAIREHIFSIVVSIVTRTPLCIIGAPGQSKTLSFQIVLQNLQGSQLSATTFCKRLPAIDPFFCLGSKYSRPEDIAYVFDRAIKRELNYRQNPHDTRCVVFLDEASLPDEKKMVLKVLHPYLDECKVAFVAVANKAFDAANANRMICVYRSLPSKDDQKILAYGCLGLQIQDDRTTQDKIIYGLCQGYRRVLTSPTIPQIFHDRDFIYMLRELRFELPTGNIEEEETSINTIKPMSLRRALEDNFNGIDQTEFEELVKIFFNSVREQVPNFVSSVDKRSSEKLYRDVPTILRDSMKLDSKRRRLYGRYKLLIDESEDESAINLLLQTGILDSDPARTTVFRMPDFPDDINNELRNVEILSTIKLCMETGKTILMVNTSRIHGSLYDVFNQNFSIMATGDVRKIFSKVAIGPKTIDVGVHEDFQCIVHIKRSEFKDIPPPFLSRFQKYSLSVNDFYRIRLQKLSPDQRTILINVEQKVQSFIQHFGREYFYGLNESTLYSCLLSLIQMQNNDEYSLLNVHQCYTQLNMKLKSFIEQNRTDIQQCLLRLILSKLIQLVSPESIILKLRAFEEKVDQWLCDLYFQQQEHFNIENFIQQLIFNPIENTDQTEENAMHITTKVMIFTRTSSHVVGLNQRSKTEAFIEHNEYSKRIDILNLGAIENSIELQERFDSYTNDYGKHVLLIIIDGRIGQQRLHIPFVRQLIDKTEYTCNNSNNRTERKYFLMLVHSPAQDLYHQSSFPSIFLRDWDFYFFDTCASGSAFHLQKMLRILSSSHEHQHQQQQSVDHILCDLNILFEDCLWEFCSRIQIILPDLSVEMFTDKMAYEFYLRRTNTIRRVECVKQILRRAKQLQTHIVEIYHQHLSAKKNSSEKIYKLIYEISKDILCGKRFDGLIDSIQSQTRNSFTNFVSNVFKFIVNDYGLDTLTKLSTDYQNYGSLLNLIDYQSFATNNDQDVFSTNTTQGIFQLVTHYSCIPQTPLYHLFHQRIKAFADEIKLTLILRQANDVENKDEPPPVTTTENYYFNNDNENNQHTFEEFRSKLNNSILNDKILVDIIGECILHSFANDLVRTVCTIAENDFSIDLNQRQQTIEAVSRWLLLIDENDRHLLENSPNKYVWLLAHVYTSVEYEQNDLISMYSACRIIDRLDSSGESHRNLFNEEDTTRSNVRERLFRSIFDHLWDKLNRICSHNENNQTWISTYTFISKYFPSEKVLQASKLNDIKSQIEFMHLTYFIFLNEKTPEPQELISNLLKATKFTKRSNCLKLLPTMIDTIQEYFQNKNINNSTLIIDLQQWIVSILKTTTQEMNFLFKYLNQPTCQLSLGLRQFLFDELTNLLLRFKQQRKENIDFWDRFTLIPTILECISDTESLENYQIPYHPSVHAHHDNNQSRSILLDLFFFHLQHQMISETITYNLLNKGMLLKPSKSENRQLVPFVENLFKQLKDYFRIKMIALLLCETNVNMGEKQLINRALSTVVTDLLPVDQPLVNLSNYLQVFLSTIITKQSWNYLLNLLASDTLQNLNREWATLLHETLKLTHRQNKNQYLQLYHQVDFALSADNRSSIFPNLHRPYDELRIIIDTCTQNPGKINQWKPFSDWILLKLISNPIDLQLNEMKTILILIIYYNYYCNNQLSLIYSLLPIIENNLQLSSEELQVFRALIQPELFMIGYSTRNTNLLNKMFQLDCQDEFDLTLRHILVNLMAMIVLSGRQSFLWTFAFQPSALINSFGFGSTAQRVIQANGVHYDCGCILSQNGDLVRFANANTSVLNVPAVYVAYFATYGAMAWHLLLFDRSVENLNGPILSPSAIADRTPAYDLAGNDSRAKTCHFVCTRFLSTYHFLSIQSNQTDTCILLTRCFEQMASLTQNQDSWIKPTYTIFQEQSRAEQEFQDKVFYFVHGKLPQYKTSVSQLNIQSQIQKNLHDFIDQIPLTIQFTHFKTELYRPIHLQSSLKILRHILNSFDFLKMTRLIYDLSQFYLLLHQTYTQLIERNEFTTITLQQLYDRSQKQLNYTDHQQHRNESKTHKEIIDKGIEAVNTYHQFADGLIRPGACDETQRFSKISLDTPVNYLVTTENHDEGDMIMRILSVLVDFHNSTLDILEKELHTNQNQRNDLLKKLVNELTSKQVSIIKIANDNTGVITLNDKDCQWIEQLSQASLITSDPQLTFDFAYVQSQIIRTYLLLCQINYKHIIQKYQCHTKRVQTTTTNNDESLNLDEKYLISLSHEQLENEWMDLKDMLLDKLYHAYNLLRQIALTLKNHSEDLSTTSLFDFVRQTDHEHELFQRLEQYQIKDFQLCHIDHVLKLYAESMSGFHYLFTDTSPLLRVPIDPQLNDELVHVLNDKITTVDYNNDVEKLQVTIQIISELLDELKSVENTLLQQSNQSLTETCRHVAIENPMIEWIPKGIKCENYIELNIHLIRTRSILQERKVNIEEKEIKLWDESFTSLEQQQQDQQASRFYHYLNSQDNEQFYEQKKNMNFSENWTLPMLNIEESIPEVESTAKYSALMELRMRLIPCKSSLFIQQIQKYREEPPVQSVSLNKAQKFTIIQQDGRSNSYLWKVDKLFEQLKKLCVSDQIAIVDKNQIFIDLNKNNDTPSSQPLSLEYHVTEKQQLVPIRFRFRAQVFEYLVTSKCNISTIVHRFIDDNQLKSLSPDTILCFSDQHGKCIGAEEFVTDISVTEENVDKSILCEMMLQYDEDQHQTQLFYSTIKWKQINTWLKMLPQQIECPIGGYAFIRRGQNNIIDDNQTISAVLDQTDSITVDVINRGAITKVFFSYETNTTAISALKSTKISTLLADNDLLKQLNCDDVFPDHCILLTGENNEQILINNHWQQPVGTYVLTGERSVRFRISLFVQIIKYDDEEQIKVPIANRETTIAQILSLTGKPVDVYKYLASSETKRVLNSNETLANLNETKFILLKDDETLLVSLVKSDKEESQRYAAFTSIANISNQYLLYENDFVPSKETRLKSLQLTLPLRFTVIDNNLPVTVTLQHVRTNQAITFNCSHSMTIKRICSIASQLFGVQEDSCQLIQDDSTLIDDADISLEDIDDSMTTIQFQVVSTVSLECTITFSEQTITLTCQRDTLASTIIKETLEKLHFPFDRLDEYELIALSDEPTGIDLDTSIDDIHQLFPPTTTTIPFQLKLIDN